MSTTFRRTRRAAKIIREGGKAGKIALEPPHIVTLALGFAHRARRLLR
jgi:hypothetical protein